jgi:hypothetical protein
MTSPTQQQRSSTWKLVGSWLFVGIPLAYGVVVTVDKATALFTG